MPVNPSPATPLPTPPSTTSPGNFDTRADNFLGALPTYQTQLDSIADITYDNAVEAAGSASSAATSASNALTSANNAQASATASANSATSAQAYAQAAGASAGVPTPTPNAYLQTDSSSVPTWGPAPVDNNKLDKLGGIANKLGFTYLDLGTIAAGGTANIDTAAATVQRVQAGGALTLTFSNLLSGAVSGEFELHCVNFGGKVITWPAGNWIKSDGSYAAAVSNSGVTWQTSGTDRVIVMVDNGVIYYKVLR